MDQSRELQRLEGSSPARDKASGVGHRRDLRSGHGVLGFPKVWARRSVIVRRRPHGRERETPLSCRGKIFDRLSSLIGADQISEDERRLAVHVFYQDGRGFLFVYFA